MSCHPCGLRGTHVAQGPGITQDSLKGFRSGASGPDITTGRISDIEFDPKNPNVWYVASASGGLFKTENRGNTFTSIFDEGGSYSLGAVVVDPKDSNTVWLATGENNNQRSVAFGDGVYKSTDAGKTWNRMGLETSEHIGKVLIDPRNSNVVRNLRPARCGARAAIAACTRRPTAARRGKRS